MSLTDSKYVKDLAERVAWTFAGAAVTVLAAAGTNLIDATVWQSAALAGGAAVFSLLKGILASQRGNSSSASMSKSV